MINLSLPDSRINPVREEHDPALGGPGWVDDLRQSFFVDKVLLPTTAPGADPNPATRVWGALLMLLGLWLMSLFFAVL